MDNLLLLGFGSGGDFHGGGSGSVSSNGTCSGSPSDTSGGSGNGKCKGSHSGCGGGWWM